MTLTAAELTSMRATAGAYLPGTAVIQSQTFVSDSGGGGTTTWTSSGTVACRLAPVMSNMGAERLTGGRISPDAEFVITLPFDTNVGENNRLLISGGTFNVAAVRDRSWELTTRVEAVKQT